MEIVTDTKLLSIGEFAAITGLTVKALHLYDELGLLPPAEVNPFSGYRRYAPAQVATARTVADLRLIGMPLARIEHLLSLGASHAAADLAAYWSQVEADTASRRVVVASLIEQLHTEEGDMVSESRPNRTLEIAIRQGIGARTAQQDAVYAGAEVFAVADGFGEGVASRHAVAALAALDRAKTSGRSESLRAAVDRAAEAIAADGAGGTTLTGFQLRGDDLLLVHLGDTRLYRVRDGEVERFTRDHTLVTELVEAGRLSEEEARSHPDRVLLNRALVGDRGGAAGVADLSRRDVRAGDRLVLTTDGVHGPIATDRFATLIAQQTDAESVADTIVDAVRAAGAEDNYALVIVDAA